MRRAVAAGLVALIFIQVTGCTAPRRVVNNTEYSDYGILNEDDVKSPNIQYEPNWWNIFLGVVFFELIIPPIYVFGYHLMRPVGPKPASGPASP